METDGVDAWAANGNVETVEDETDSAELLGKQTRKKSTGSSA